MTKQSRLLELLPGVRVAWVRSAPSLVRIGLAVRSLSSLAHLAHIALAANVLLVVEADWHWQGGNDDPECLRYDMRVSSENEPEEPPSNLQVVGTYLVRCLERNGRLSSDEAKALLRAWNAAVD